MSNCIAAMYYGTTSIAVTYFPKENADDVVAQDGITKQCLSACLFENSNLRIGKSIEDKDLLKENCIFNSKRLLGVKVFDKRVEEECKQWPFKIIPDEHDNPLIQFQSDPSHTFSLEVILSKFLINIREEYTSELNSIILPVSGCFNSLKRLSYVNACKLAGIPNYKLVNEPTASAVAFANRNGECIPKSTLLIYDFGGGTFDCSVIKVEQKVITVLATGGDSHLGGEDVTNNLVNYYANLLKEKTGTDIFEDGKELLSLRYACEEAKVQLTSAGSATIDYKPLIANKIDSTLKCDLFNEINKELFERSIVVVKETIKESGINENEIDCCVLVGGSSIIQYVQTLLLDLHIDMFRDAEAVSYGIRSLAKEKLQPSENEYRINEILTYNLGITRNKDGSNIDWIMKKNIPIPYAEKRSYKYDKKDGDKIVFYVYETIGSYDTNKLSCCQVIVENLSESYPDYDLEFVVDSHGLFSVSASVPQIKCSVY